MPPPWIFYCDFDDAEIVIGEEGDPSRTQRACVVGTVSIAHAVRSADVENAAMTARGWEPAWSPGRQSSKRRFCLGRRSI